MEKYKQNLRIDGNKIFSYNTHVATIDGHMLIRHGWYSVTTSKHVNYVARELGLTLTDMPKDEPEPEQSFKSVAMVAAMGEILCNSPKEVNDWKKRMLIAGVPGISFPDDFDNLPEEERARRINTALEVLK